MRNTAILLVATLIGVACADQNPSAPGVKSANGAIADIRANTSAGNAAAKPPAQVGFTKVTKVYGQTVAIPANSFGSGSAKCPDGSTLTGGGYQVNNYADFPRIYRTSDDNSNGWKVDIDNAGTPYGLILLVTAYCAS